MCGISGIMHKHAGASALAPIGEELVRMLDAMKHRGIDSTGITVAGEDSNSDFIVRVWSDPDADYRGRFRAVEEAVVAKGGVVKNRQSNGRISPPQHQLRRRPQCPCSLLIRAARRDYPQHRPELRGREGRGHGPGTRRQARHWRYERDPRHRSRAPGHREPGRHHPLPPLLGLPLPRCHRGPQRPADQLSQDEAQVRGRRPSLPDRE